MHNITKRFFATLAALSLLLSFSASTALAQCSQPVATAGPVVAGNGFPQYFVDANGLALELCLDVADCIDPAEDSFLPDPLSALSFPANFPAATFWWYADTRIPLTGNVTGRFIAHLIAAFDNETAIAGDQLSSVRMRLSFSGLQPNSSYTVSHPYGTLTMMADAGGSIDQLERIDSLVGGATPGDFSIAESSVGGFLVFDDPDPAKAPLPGHIGNPEIAHLVTGSPCGQNYLRIEGPGLPPGGLQSDDFFVLGKQINVCGNGIADTGEECDDANNTSSDCCSSTCALEDPSLLCDDANGCTDEVCVVGSGCFNNDNTLPCDDSNACTTTDTCSAGACVSGPALPCDDGQFCTGVETCDPASGCQDNADPNADDGVGCTDDSCDEVNDVIVNAVNDSNCDDGLFCTGVETCHATMDCQDGADPNADDGVGCTDDSCDEVNDVIVNAVNDALCDDEQFCTGVETCHATMDCQDNADPNADDGVGCTDDSCDEVNDVIVNAVNDSNCDDGLFCTGVETCHATMDCQDNADPDPNDGVACTNDSCDEAADALVNTPIDSACDDGDVCTDNVCVVGSGCANPNNTADCEDGDPTTWEDQCSVGVCESGYFACPMFPLDGCRAPFIEGRSSISMRKTDNGVKDFLKWNWKNGVATSLADYGDPVNGIDQYSLCLYDEDNDVPTLVVEQIINSGGTCGKKSCWKGSPRMFKYHSKGVATAHGVGNLKMKRGEDGKAFISAKAKGIDAALPTEPLLVDSHITMQFISQPGECWETVFDAANVSTKTGRLKAK